MASQAKELGHPKAAHTVTVKEATKGECPICFEHVKSGEEMVTVQCKHWFHSSCFNIWRKEGQTGQTCSMCRRPTVSTEEQKFNSLIGGIEREVGYRASTRVGSMLSGGVIMPDPDISD